MALGEIIKDHQIQQNTVNKQIKTTRELTVLTLQHDCNHRMKNGELTAAKILKFKKKFLCLQQGQF